MHFEKRDSNSMNNSIHLKIICIAFFYDTIAAKPLYRKLRFYIAET